MNVTSASKGAEFRGIVDIAEAVKEMEDLQSHRYKVGAFLYGLSLAETRWFDSVPDMENYICREIHNGMDLVGIIFYRDRTKKRNRVFIRKYGNFPEGSPEHQAIQERASLIGPAEFV